MRLAKIEVSGFRAFAREQAVDLDADAVILCVPNGYGKTSLLDGILWALCGRVPRLASDDKDLVSVYSSSGSSRVAVELRNGADSSIRLARTFDGDQQHVRLEVNGEVFREDEGKFLVVRTLWPDALATADSAAALASAITRSAYLQQDLVRQFVEADTEQERFAAVSELVGVGRVTDLHIQLDRAKANWTRATNARGKDAEAVRSRLRSLQSQLEATVATGTRIVWDVPTIWPIWWAKAAEFGVDVPFPSDAASNDAPHAL